MPINITNLSENVLSKAKAGAKRVTSLGDELGSFIKENPIITGASVIATGTALTAGISAVRRRKKTTTRKKKRKVKKAKRRKVCYVRRKRKPAKRGKRRYTYARTAGKRRDTSTRRIRQTKHGQPYVILKSGKARFIKRSSARRSRKLKGGRY